MIRSVITNDILKQIMAIEGNRIRVSDVVLPAMVMNKLRKNSRKKSSYASNKIEGNPLTEEQAFGVIDADPHKHFLRPEQEIRNYFLALSFLEDKRKKGEKVSRKLIMDVRAIVEKGASKEKIGLRGAMPPGVLFAVYDSQTGAPDYIPPEYTDIPVLLDELVHYLDTTDDHPLIIAAIAHYQLVTIHPFEDGNGRTARLISGYLLDYYGYGFQGIGSLEEYFAYNPQEYYDALQMGLPALYYSGRMDPPHPEIWFGYFLRMMELYSNKVYELSKSSGEQSVAAGISFLNAGEKEMLEFLLRNDIREYTPKELGKKLNVSNKTIINRTVKLVNNGFVFPVLVKERIMSYLVSEYACDNKKEILMHLSIFDVG